MDADPPRSVTSRARSVSPPPFEVELLSLKPLPSPKLTAEEDPFAAHTTHKRRSLSVVKLEEMAAHAAAEAEANNAAQDKTLPAPPVPSRRLLGAQEIFKDNTADTSTDVPRTPSLSALSLLRPPQRHDQQPLPKQEEDSLDALERRLVE